MGDTFNHLKQYKLDCGTCAGAMTRLGQRYWFCIACRRFVIRKPSRALRDGEGDCV